ncbi:YciI-like protein [Zunongwangia endophytica]|uniref:YciI-like protein n=1 Tax=Zunongwangia endophytica TaxID=1808945 RepID=A0ABV8H4G7_9FLAO|nr:YciI-like protein [Zunongwangia endophytica]MDN3595485.1 YciI-like protein [Zunongwangia endophytica]
MNYYILTYHLVDSYLEERGKYREEHLAMAKKGEANGEIVMAGALDNPSDKAIFIFKSESEATATNFAENDPYFKNGLIKEYSVRKWNVVIGN